MIEIQHIKSNLGADGSRIFFTCFAPVIPKTFTMKMFFMKKSNVIARLMALLLLLTFIGTPAQAQFDGSPSGDDCSCELALPSMVVFQSPFDECCYAFVLPEIIVEPEDPPFPALNDCVQDQDETVYWNIDGPTGNVGTSTGPNQPLIQCFTDGEWTICARRAIKVTNPITGLVEECSYWACETLVIEGCGEEECVCEPENLGINIGSIDVNGCNIYVSGSSEPQDGCWTLESIEYDWGDNTSEVINDTWVSGRHSYACNGVYEVTITGTWVNDLGEICQSSDSEFVSITNCNACLQGFIPVSDEIEGSSNTQVAQLQIYPNPVDGQLVLQHAFPADMEATVVIMSNLGQRMTQEIINTDSQNLQLDTSALPTGAYYVIIQLENGERVAKPFVKQ